MEMAELLLVEVIFWTVYTEDNELIFLYLFLRNHCYDLYGVFKVLVNIAKDYYT